MGVQLKAYDYSTLQTRYNERFTHRAGLLSIAHLMDSLSLAEPIDQHFPQPKSNRGYRPSEFIKILILMQHEGSFHLDDIRHLQDDEALRRVLALKKLPQATTLGDWLRRVGAQPPRMPGSRSIEPCCSQPCVAVKKAPPQKSDAGH